MSDITTALQKAEELQKQLTSAEEEEHNLNAEESRAIQDATRRIKQEMEPKRIRLNNIKSRIKGEMVKNNEIFIQAHANLQSIIAQTSSWAAVAAQEAPKKNLLVAVREFCSEQNLRMKDVADQIGMSPSYFSRCLHGFIPMPEQYLEQMKKFGVKI